MRQRPTLVTGFWEQAELLENLAVLCNSHHLDSRSFLRVATKDILGKSFTAEPNDFHYC